MVEINPFVQDAFGNAVVLDAKVNYDDNSLVRQPDVVSRRDFSQVRKTAVVVVWFAVVVVWFVLRFSCPGLGKCSGCDCPAT